MKVLQLQQGKVKIGAYVKVRGDGRQECELLRAFNGVENNERASRDRLLLLLKLAADRGIGALHHGQFHVIDQERKIYEFIAGRLRVVCFFTASGEIIVCTHVFMKKQQKAPRSEVDRAVRCQDLLNNDQGNIEWMERLE